MLAPYARDKRLADACYLWAFAAVTASARAAFSGRAAFVPQRSQRPSLETPTVPLTLVLMDA